MVTNDTAGRARSLLAKRRRRLGAAAFALLVLTLLYASSFVVSWGSLLDSEDPLVRRDVARLTPARVERVDRARSVGQLRTIVREAGERGLKVSISGSRHSQGGHTYTEGGVVLDMRSFNRIVVIDTISPSITVESGATWDEVQRAIAPHGLAVKVMQSSNIFTVGGTLSANGHGRDLDQTQVVEVVDGFRLLLADGRVVNVSREENAELFSLVIGGYGLYGVILDVTLRVTRDELYEQPAISMDFTELPRYLDEQVRPDADVVLFLARPSIDPDPDSFLREVVVVTWRRAATGQTATLELTEEEHVLRDKFFLGLSRRFDWAKSLRWVLQKRVELGLGSVRVMSRNNAMRPPLAPLELLDYRASRDADIIQEFFVPVDRFASFMNRFREILQSGQMNVLSSTVRFVSANATPVLGYAPDEDALAVVHMSNVELSDDGQARAEAVTRRLVDAAIAHGGTYYLTYQLYPTSEQLHRAYPGAAHAFERKRFYDPAETFSSQFWERYGHTSPD